MPSLPQKQLNIQHQFDEKLKGIRDYPIYQCIVAHHDVIPCPQCRLTHDPKEDKCGGQGCIGDDHDLDCPLFVEREMTKGEKELATGLDKVFDEEKIHKSNMSILTEQQKKFDEKFVTISEDRSLWSWKEVPSVGVIRYAFLSSNTDILKKVISRIDEEIKEHKVPWQANHFTGCVHCGAEANMTFVDSKMNEVYDSALNTIKSYCEEEINKAKI